MGSGNIGKPLALLNITLGYSLGHGTSIGFSFDR